VKPIKIDWTVWKPRLLYGGFFAAVFLLALRQTFPTEAVKERLILEAAAQGWQLDADSLSPAGVVGVSANNLRLEDRNGRKLAAESVALTLRLLPLMVGRRSVAFDVSIWDGRIRGTADLSGAQRRYTADVEKVDLAAATPLRKATGLELLGTLSATADVTLPEDAKGKPGGRVTLGVKDAGVNGGQLPVPAMGGSVSLPKVALGQLTGEIAFEEGRGNVKKLEARGGDAEVSTDGLYFVWQPRLEFSQLFGRASVKLQDAFWNRSGTAGFRSVAEMALASAKGRDGGYQFQIFGSVGHPQMRPLPSGQ